MGAPPIVCLWTLPFEGFSSNQKSWSLFLFCRPQWSPEGVKSKAGGRAQRGHRRHDHPKGLTIDVRPNRRPIYIFIYYIHICLCWGTAGPQSSTTTTSGRPLFSSYGPETVLKSCAIEKQDEEEIIFETYWKLTEIEPKQDLDSEANKAKKSIGKNSDSSCS